MLPVFGGISGLIRTTLNIDFSPRNTQGGSAATEGLTAKYAKERQSSEYSRNDGS